MMILQLPSSAGAEPVAQEIDTDARKRVSGPGLRTFLTIADRYGVSTQDRIALLGEPSKSTYHEWVRKARDAAPLALPLDVAAPLELALGRGLAP